MMVVAEYTQQPLENDLNTFSSSFNGGMLRRMFGSRSLQEPLGRRSHPTAHVIRRR